MARMFGTNGVRGVVNEDMTAQLALRMGKAVGSVFPGIVAVAVDTRDSGPMLANAAAAGLMAVGCKVRLLGILPTPALQYYVKMHPDVSCGVMITASHNPPEFNGIKVIAPDGTECSRDQEELIENRYADGVPDCATEETGTCEHISGAAEIYVDAVAGAVDSEAIRQACFTAVVDAANGAAYMTTPMLMRKLGVRVITVNCNPQGDFPGHLSEPAEENLHDTISMIVASKADIGIVHDGDADRCIFIDDTGRYVNGDDALAVIGAGILSQGEGEIVTPVATSDVVEAAAIKAGGKVAYTAVGSPAVARRMMADKAVFGGEGNGGLIFPEFQYCRDGAMAAAKMLEFMAKSGPLSKQVDALPMYYTVKRKVVCPNELKPAAMKHIDSMTKNIDGKDTTDGLKIRFENGWVLLRPSGTEPIFRITSDSRDKKYAEELADKYQDMVESFVKSSRRNAFRKPLTPRL